jgi:hypothetical protein
MPSLKNIFVELLENRRLMDSTLPLHCAPMNSLIPSPELVESSHAIGPAPRGSALATGVRVPVPNLLGNWTGTAKFGSSAFTQTLGFRLYVKKQTPTTLTGGIVINNEFYGGTSKLRWSGRNFTIHYHAGKFDVTIRGMLNRPGNAFTATATVGGSTIFVGHISATRMGN